MVFSVSIFKTRVIRVQKALKKRSLKKPKKLCVLCG